MFDADGNVNWTFYYTELIRAKSDRLKFLVIGFLAGVIAATGGIVILIDYLELLP